MFLMYVHFRCLCLKFSQRILSFLYFSFNVCLYGDWIFKKKKCQLYADMVRWLVCYEHVMDTDLFGAWWLKKGSNNSKHSPIHTTQVNKTDLLFYFCKPIPKVLYVKVNQNLNIASKNHLFIYNCLKIQKEKKTSLKEKTRRLLLCFWGANLQSSDSRTSKGSNWFFGQSGKAF